VRRAALASFLLALAAPVGAGAALPPRVDVRAQHVALYTGAPPLLSASGSAIVHFGNAFLRADALRYDLGKNRIVASGHVTLSSSERALDADVYALDLASGSAVALELGASAPRTLVFSAGAHDGRIAPPPEAAFDVADLGGQAAFITGSHAVVVPNATVRFTPARVRTDVRAMVPVPSYLFSFESSPSFAQQSLPASTFDQPYGLFGTPNSLAALHFTYAQGTGLAVGLDEHLVNGTKSYLVASALPTVAGGRYDLFGFEQLTPTMTQQIIATRQGGYIGGQYQLLHNEAETATSLTLSQAAGLESADLRISSLTHRIPRLFSYKLSADLGYDHQSGMLPSSSDARTSLEGLVTTPSLHLPLGASFSSSLDVTRTVFEFPRETGSTSLTSFLTKQISPPLRLIGIVQFTQVFDRYRIGQSFFYPPQVLTLPDGALYYGYAAYNGASTLRSYALTGTFAPNPNFTLTLGLTHHRDFPQFDGYGNPPYSLAFDVRVRPPGGPSIEVGRSYLFNWGGQRFSPAYTLSIAP